MSVCLEQVVAPNYATTQLEATHAPVTLATHFTQTVVHAKVSIKTILHLQLLTCIHSNIRHQ